MIKYRVAKPLLQPRKERSAECYSCPQVLNLHYIGRDRKRLLEDVNSDEAQQQALCQAVDEWEQVQNGEMPRKRARTGPERKIEAFEGTKFRLQRNMGVFWPLQLWNQHYPEQKPAKKEITSIEGHGKGVVRELTFGTPIGTLNMSAIADTGATIVTKVADSQEQVRDNELDDAWGAISAKAIPALQRTNVGTEAMPKMVHKLSFADLAKKSNDDEDDDDQLHTLWKRWQKTGGGKATKSRSTSGTSASTHGGGADAGLSGVAVGGGQGGGRGRLSGDR